MDGGAACAVIPTGDQCPHTSLCADGLNADGCTANQASCVAQWDCTQAEWSDCDDATGTRTRDITKCLQPTDPQCLQTGLTPSPTSSCVVEKEFPFFGPWNLLGVLGLLLSYYLVRRRL